MVADYQRLSWLNKKESEFLHRTQKNLHQSFNRETSKQKIIKKLLKLQEFYENKIPNLKDINRLGFGIF